MDSGKLCYLFAACETVISIEGRADRHLICPAQNYGVRFGGRALKWARMTGLVSGHEGGTTVFCSKDQETQPILAAQPWELCR